MSAQQLIDALSASFFCLLGLWAAAARGHWFLRVAVAGGCLLGALLIPAHLVAIEFGIQITVIMLGVAIARKPKKWRPRFSMETILLAMVVAAVAAAVLQTGSEWHVATWIWVLGVGAGTGLLALTCLWLVCGRARWYWRALGLAAFLALFAAGGLLVDAVRKYLWQSQSGLTLAAAVGEQLQWDAVKSWLEWNGPSVALGVAIVLVTIWLAVHSGWFGESASREPLSRIQRAGRYGARCGIGATLLSVLVPLLLVFYRLMTPESLWRQTPPNPNGISELVTAGKQVPKLAGRSLIRYNFWRAPASEIIDLVQVLEPAYVQIDAALRKPCLAPVAHAEDSDAAEADNALAEVATALILRWRLLGVVGTDEEFIHSAFSESQFFAAQTGRQGIEAVGDANTRFLAWSIRQRLWRLSAEQCRRQLDRLLEFEASLEPYDVLVRRQRILDQNADWEKHLTQILNDWNVAWGRPDDQWWRWFEWHDGVAELRLAIAEVALQAHWLETGSLPRTLDDLAPEYLPATPTDPYDGKPLRYRRNGKRYVLYSVGWNVLDDGGSDDTTSGAQLSFDRVVRGPHRPANWRLAGDALASQVDAGLAKLFEALREWAEQLQEEQQR